MNMLSSLIAFLLGMLASLYLFPPTPTHELCDMDKRVIAYEVIQWMDEADWNILAAKRHIVTLGATKKEYNFWGF